MKLEKKKREREREKERAEEKKGRNALATLFGLHRRELWFDLSHHQKFSAWQYIQDYLQSLFCAL